MNRLTKITLLIPISLCLVLTLTSCVTHRDIEHMNIVLGAAFDYNPDTELYQVHVQVPKTQAFAKGEGAQGNEESYVIFHGKGETLFLAIRDMAKNGMVFFWGHCENYVISNRLAGHGIYECIDFLIRDAEIRGEAYLLVSSVPLEELLSLPRGSQNVPMMAITPILEEGLNVYGKGIKVQIDDVFNNLLYEESSHLISLLDVTLSDYQAKEETDKFNVSGAAVFKDDTMIGSLSPTETRGYNFITNQIKNTLINIEFRGGRLVIENTNSSVNVTVTENGNVGLLVEVKPRGNIGQFNKPLNLENPNVIEEIENIYAAAIKREVESTIERAQILQADFLGFGREVEIANPELWAEFKKRWQQEIFPEIEITVTVKPTVVHTGLAITTVPEEKYAQY
ncbi:Ger(x)C family spore germination protein [Peptococcaceae bacterium 1198_IL3148]